MTPKEKEQLQVLNKLIPIYTEAINRIADGEDAEEVLYKTNTLFGICYCARSNNIAEMYRNDWVGQNVNYWYDYPYDYCNDILQIIECLSYRLTIMQLMVMDLTGE